MSGDDKGPNPKKAKNRALASAARLDEELRRIEELNLSEVLESDGRAEVLPKLEAVEARLSRVRAAVAEVQAAADQAASTRATLRAEADARRGGGRT